MKWININKRMPDIGQEVLIRIPVCGVFNIENGVYRGEGVFSGAWCTLRGVGHSYKVTHWISRPCGDGIDD